MKVEYYIDVIFLIQFVALFIVIDISSFVLKWQGNLWKRILAALFASFYYCGYFIFVFKTGMTNSLAGGVILFLGIILAIYMAGFKGNVKQWVIGAGMVIIMTMFLAGAAMYLKKFFKANTLLLWIAAAFAFDGLTKGLFGFFRLEKQASEAIKQVKIQIQKKEIFVNALYDSGNRLLDPYTARPVAIINEKIMKKQGVEMKNSVLIPYYSLGEQQGMIKGILAEELIVLDTGKSYKKIYLAINEELFCQQSEYDLILHYSMA